MSTLSINGEIPRHYCWVYKGDVTESLRDKVASAGGRLDGAIRVPFGSLSESDSYQIISKEIK